MARRILLTVVATVAVAHLAPSGAAAGTLSTSVRYGECSHRDGCWPDVLIAAYAAEPGERNALVVRVEAGGTIVLEDHGAAVRVSGVCSARSERAVACPPHTELEARLGDLADTAVTDARAGIDGEDGDDVLRAGARGAALIGGAGADVLSGGPAPDVLWGGAGADVAMGAGGNDTVLDADDAPARDAYDGGPGRDVVSYLGRAAPVTVRLAAGTGGAPGEGDALASFEGARGGDAGDRLTGTPGRDELDGGSGADTLAGRGAADRLLGRGGADRVVAGTGDDWVAGGGGRDRLALGSGDDVLATVGDGDRADAGPGADRVRSTAPASTRSRLRCGAGHDTLAAESQGLPMIVAADCETVRMDTGRVGLRTPLATLGAVVGRLDAGCTGGRPPCRVRVELRVAAAPGQRLRGRWAAGRLLGSVSAQIRPGRRVRRLGVRLEPRARRLLARRGVLLVRVLVRRDVDIPRGEFDSAGFPIRLHAP